MDYTITTSWSWLLILVTARTAGLVLIAPALSSKAIPVRFRLFLSVILALAMLPLVSVESGVPSTFVLLLTSLGLEFAIGATIGYACRLIFVGVEIAAQQIGQQMGLSLAESYGGSPETSGILRRLLYLMAIVVFFGLGGHRMMIGALQQTFRVTPLLGFTADENLLSRITQLLAASFVLALKVAAPVLVAMALATLVLALIQRSLPQYNTLSVGLPIRMFVGMVALAGGLVLFAALIEQAIGWTSSELDSWMNLS